MNLFRRKIDVLLGKAAELGRRDVTMPIDIFALARKFADLPDRAETFRRTQAELLPHSNAFVRRVFFTTLRFMGDAGPPSMELTDVVLVGLDDVSAWVCYDAAWLAASRKVSSPAILGRLREFAATHDPDADIEPGNAEANLRKCAADALDALHKAG